MLNLQVFPDELEVVLEACRMRIQQLEQEMLFIRGKQAECRTDTEYESWDDRLYVRVQEIGILRAFVQRSQ